MGNTNPALPGLRNKPVLTNCHPPIFASCRRQAWQDCPPAHSRPVFAATRASSPSFVCASTWPSNMSSVPLNTPFSSPKGAIHKCHTRFSEEHKRGNQHWRAGDCNRRMLGPFFVFALNEDPTRPFFGMNPSLGVFQLDAWRPQTEGQKMLQAYTTLSLMPSAELRGHSGCCVCASNASKTLLKNVTPHQIKPALV